jgi:hypothetical protein
MKFWSLSPKVQFYKSTNMNEATVIVIGKYLATSEGGSKEQHTGLLSSHMRERGWLHRGGGVQLCGGK